MRCETSLAEGLRKISQTRRPGMVFIHKTWCEVCRGLRPKLLASKTINKMSEQFVVISLLDDAEPRDKSYHPDGGYIPRVLFLNPQGQVLREVCNEKNNKYKYYYTTEDSLLRSMNKVLKTFPTT